MADHSQPVIVGAVLLLTFALPGIMAMAICCSVPTVDTHPSARNSA